MNQEVKAAEPVIVTAFGPVQLPPVTTKESCSEDDIVDTLIVDTFESDDEGNIRPVTKQIVTGKKNRKAYIESFSDEVGLQNILEKIGQGAIAEDKYSILKSNKLGEIHDLTGLQQVNSMADIQALAANARATFAHLDPELKKNMSFAEFCAKFNNQDLIAYVKAKTTFPESKKKVGENE